jgi:hypothetical protein
LYPHSIDETITDASAVQRLYAAAQALPPIQQGAVYNCPAEIANLVYTLTFLRGTTVVRTVHLQATGCQFLSFSATDIRVTNASFMTLFHRTIDD